MEFKIDRSVFLELGGGEGRVVWNESFSDILPNPDSDSLVFTIKMSNLLLFNENKQGTIQSLNLGYYPIELDNKTHYYIIENNYIFVKLGVHNPYARSLIYCANPSKKETMFVSEALSHQQIYQVLLIAAKKLNTLTFNHKQIWNLTA